MSPEGSTGIQRARRLRAPREDGRLRARRLVPHQRRDRLRPRQGHRARRRAARLAHATYGPALLGHRRRGPDRVRRLLDRRRPIPSHLCDAPPKTRRSVDALTSSSGRSCATWTNAWRRSGCRPTRPARSRSWAARTHVVRRGPALCARRARRADARRRPSLRGAARRRARLARAALGLPRQHHPPARPARAARGRLRLVPHVAAARAALCVARSRAPEGAWDRRAARLRAARGPPPAEARRAPTCC